MTRATRTQPVSARAKMPVRADRLAVPDNSSPNTLSSTLAFQGSCVEQSVRMPAVSGTSILHTSGRPSIIAASVFAASVLVGSFGCSGDVNEPDSTPGDKPDNGEETTDLPVRDTRPLIAGDEFRCDPSKEVAPEARVRRLSSAEYVNVVRDILSVDVRSEVKDLPDTDPTAREFNNQSLLTSRQHTDAFEALAETIAGRVEMERLRIDYVPDCDELSASCQDKFISRVGRLLFRGPVSDREKELLSAVFATAEENDVEDFDEAAGYVLQAMLQSPRFLFRLEDETSGRKTRDVSPYAMASRLSFAIWQSAPDDDLLEAAADDALSTEDEITEQVNRMLKDTRAREAAVTFLDDWADLHRLDDGANIKASFADFDTDLLADMRDETRALFAKVVKEGRPLSDLFNLQETTISKRLAEHYGLPDPKNGVQTYDLTDVPERGGLLTHGSMSSLGGVDGSPVRIGLHLMGELLCGEMEDPPPGLEVDFEPPEEGVSAREGSQTRVEDTPCDACHKQFEPLAWGLLRYRATGAYAEKDVYGNELAEDGWIVFPDDPSQEHHYDNPAEMMDLLAGNARVRDCILMKATQYVEGRPLTRSDSCALDDVRRALPKDPSWDDMVRTITLSSTFRTVTPAAP